MAEELTKTPASSPSVRYCSQRRAHLRRRVARVLGAAIGQPDLQWVTISDDQTRQGLEQRGLPPHIAANYVELGASIHNGSLRQGYLQHKPQTMGRVKVEDFAKEFAAAF